MRRHLPAYLALLGALFTSSACGSSSPVQPSTTAAFTASELGAIQATIAQATSLAFSQIAAALSPPGVPGGMFTRASMARPQSSSGTIQVSQPCASSGSIGVTGSSSQNLDKDGSGSVSMSLTTQFSGCGANGARLDGNLSYSGQVTVSNANPAGTSTFAESGNLAFSEDNLSGQVALDCTMSVTFNPQHVTASGNVTYDSPTGQHSVVSCLGY